MVKIIPKDPDVAPKEIIVGTRPAREVKLVHKEIEIKPEELKEKKTRVSKLDRKKAKEDEALGRLYTFIETEPKKKDVREYFIKRLEELS